MEFLLTNLLIGLWLVTCPSHTHPFFGGVFTCDVSPYCHFWKQNYIWSGHVVVKYFELFYRTLVY